MTAATVKKKKPTAAEGEENLVRSVRSALGLSQGEFGLFLGVHDQTVWRWEKGQFAPTPMQEQILQVTREVLDGPQSAATAAVVRDTLRGVETVAGDTPGVVQRVPPSRPELAPLRAVYAVLHAWTCARAVT